MKHILIMLFIITLIFLSGCISQRVGDGLLLSLYADPQTIFGDGITKLYIDIDNRDVKTIENVVVTAFDTGLLKYIATEDWEYIYEDMVCQKRYNDLKPGQFDTFSCSFYAPKIDLPSLQTDIHVKAEFNTEFSVVQLVEMMTVDEYARRVASNKFTPRPQSYSYRDKYVELQIDFSEQLPIVVREGKKYFVYFTVKNVGNGFIGSIQPQNFYFEQQGNLIECKSEVGGKTYLLELGKSLDPIGKSFPRLACEIYMPSNLEYLTNYELIIHLKYDYEIRDKITINIVR